MTEAAVLPGVTQQNLKRQCLKENVADGAEHRERHPERIGCLEETENIAERQLAAVSQHRADRHDSQKDRNAGPDNIFMILNICKNLFSHSCLLV